LDHVDVVADDEGRPVELLRLPDEGRGFRLKNEEGKVRKRKK